MVRKKIYILYIRKRSKYLKDDYLTFRTTWKQTGYRKRANARFYLQNYKQGSLNDYLPTTRRLFITERYQIGIYLSKKIIVMLQIYLGMNQWLPMQSWNLITTDCKSPAQFIRQMMVAMFPYQTLLQQTVTGKGSNRNRSGPPSEGRLDPEKVLAIKCKIISEIILVELLFDKNSKK